MAKKEAESKVKTVSLNIDETKEFMHHIIPNNRFIQDKGEIPVAIEIKGESGIGKTSITLQLAKELNLSHVKLNLSQIEELGDLVGFPIRQFEVCKDDNCIWIDEHAVDSYTHQGYQFTGKNRTSYCPPQWIADKMDRGGFLILDDWNRADMRFIQAVMELVDRQTYVSWKLPKDWHIVLTSNPDDGEYLVQSIDPAQRTRFISINLKFDINCWGRWAEFRQLDSRCITFLLKNPELINPKVNARSAVMFFNSISSIKDFGNEKSLALINNIGEGSVGSEFTSMFVTFIHNKLDKMLSPEEILTKNEEFVLKELKASVNSEKAKMSEDGYRADIAAVVAQRLVNHCSFWASSHKEKVTKDVINRIKTLIKSGIFQKDLCYTICKGIYTSNASVYKELTLDKDTVKYILQ